MKLTQRLALQYLRPPLSDDRPEGGRGGDEAGGLQRGGQRACENERENTNKLSKCVRI